MKEFFDYVRKGILGPTLDQGEVDGCNVIIGAGRRAGWKTSWIAYALATAYHETSHSMLPISEFGGNAYFTRMYDIKGNRPTMAKQHGNTTPGDGIKYRGRGYVQLTWKDNYAKAEKLCGIKGLVANPDLAMIPENAAKIMISGMQGGWFTGVGVAKYMPNELATVEQFKQARRIINGTDKADLIAGYAIEFQKALNR